jgi:1-aminocyclopropane-1-carboxylate deaminase/D-cysteine desulfhydrase-like pyridoxal-dependent ACC family enzyme
MNTEKEQQLVDAIGKLPRVALASIRPTPLEPMSRLSAHLGGPPLYIKRDDLTGLAMGGNKTRMFEFSLADALAKGADTIVAGSAVQSNYCRQLAAACAKLDLELHLVLRPVRPADKIDQQGNNLLQRLLGAHVTVIDEYDHAAQKAAIQAKIAELSAKGKKVYWPRQEDTVDLDAIAYAESALEVVQQCRDLEIAPAHFYLCALDTTQAGVGLGLAWVESDMQLRGFCPMKDAPNRCAEMAIMANQGARRLGLDIELKGDDFANDDSFVGERYGIPTPEGLDALRTVARTEGILLDPVYTSKAMAALFQHIREGQLDKERPVVFLHTGGNPALFAYGADVLDG